MYNNQAPCPFRLPCNARRPPLRSGGLLLVGGPMKRTRIVMFALAAVFALGVRLGHAEDAAPAEKAPKVLEPLGGCMPDGGCCGQGACARAAAAGEKNQNGAPAGDAAAGSAADSGGGCPCSKMKKKAM